MRKTLPDFCGQHLGSDGFVDQGLHAVAHRRIFVKFFQFNSHGNDELVLSDFTETLSNKTGGQFNKT